MALKLIPLAMFPWRHLQVAAVLLITVVLAGLVYFDSMFAVPAVVLTGLVAVLRVARVSMRQRALAESEAHFRLIADLAPVMIWVSDTNKVCNYFNRPWLSFTGRGLEESLGNGWLEAVHPQELAHCLEVYSRAFDEQMAFVLYFRLRRHDGEYRMIEGHGVPSYDAGGRFTGHIGTCVDITERTHAEEALRESEAHLRLFVEHTPAGVAMLDRDMRYLVVSRRCMEDYEMVGRDIIGLSIYETFPGAPDPWKQIHRRALAGEVVHADRESLLRQDGRQDWIRWEVRPWYTAAQEIGGIIIFTEFITERIEAEQAREKLEAQLHQAQKMEALGTLSGGVAHDLNNILSAILGNADLAWQDTAPGHPALKSIAEIRQAGQRGKQVVQRLLLFSRPREPQRDSISLRPIAEEVVQLLRSTLPAGVELMLVAPADVPAVQADATQVYQVLLNLATNAWQAMEGHVGRIELRLTSCRVDNTLSKDHPDLHPGPYVRLSVSDTGKGMDSTTLTRIFEPFFTTKSPGEGTGLGLSVVHGIMRSHGGAIVVESEPGLGSTFHLYFPTTLSTPASTPSSSMPTLAQGHGEHILYLDDEEPLVFLAERLLTRWGYRVTGHTQAADAIAAFRAAPQTFDLVITDYNMPGMSGMDVAQELLKIYPDAPIVLASGYLRPDDLAKAHALGIRETILKPNTFEELGAIVSRMLSNKRITTPS